MFPPTHPFSSFSGGVVDIGDLEFLRDKELAGDLIVVTGTTRVIAPVTVVSITPAAGKTFFIAKSGHIHSDISGTADDVSTNLQNDGVDKDIKRTTIRLGSGTAGGNGPIYLEGNVVGDSLIGDGARLYRIQKTLGGVIIDVSGTITGWIQDT